MESFSLLKYWRTSGGGDSTTNARAATKTLFTAASGVGPELSDDEEGPYFDLEFALPDENDSDNEEEAKNGLESDEKAQNKESESQSESSTESLSVNEEDEGELKLTIESSECTEDQNVKVSPSEELLFKGNLVSIEPSSILLNGSDENSKIPVSVLKSATKFRVLLLKLKKSKSGNGFVEKTEKIEGNNSQQELTSKIQEKQGKQSDKLFAVKLKVDEVKAPLVSYFTRDNSSKQNHCKGAKDHTEDSSESNAASDEKKLSKEVVQKYLNMVKPLYIRVSKRYVEKLKFSGHLNFLGGDSNNGGAVTPPSVTAEKAGEVVTSCVRTNLKQGNSNLQAGLKVVRKHLGKSRSASATVAPPQGKMSSDRRDDSLLQLQDGIQGAILHCKKSFNGSRDGESSSVLSRSASDPSYEKSVMTRTVSSASASSYSGEAKEIKV